MAAGWSTHPWPFTPRAELSIFFGGLVADDEETAAKALMALSSAAITSQDSISNILAIIMADSGASGHYLLTPSSVTSSTICRSMCISLRAANLSLPGELCWMVRRKACCKNLSPRITATNSSFLSILWWRPGLGATCSR